MNREFCRYDVKRRNMHKKVERNKFYKSNENWPIDINVNGRGWQIAREKTLGMILKD
jgi:hypothetical protein